MAASTERIREVVEQYVALVGSGTADEIVALYADGATVEDPVGSDVLTGAEAIRGFYAGLEGLDTEDPAARAAGRRRRGGVPLRDRDHGGRRHLHASRRST